MNSGIIIKIITLHLHSTLQQNEFQSNLPDIFTKDHLAESQGSIFRGGTPQLCTALMEPPKSRITELSRELMPVRSCQGTRTYLLLRSPILLHSGASAPQVNAAISEKERGGRVSDLLKTSILLNLERRNRQSN